MITYWLVALLIGLLLVDFTSYLRTTNPSHHLPWTIPNSLLIASTIMATFCIGLAWRYSANTRNLLTTSPSVSSSSPDTLNSGSWGLFEVTIFGNNFDLLSSWLPFVLFLLALCIIAGFVDSWRGHSPENRPIRNPYLLLETSQPIPEPSRVSILDRKVVFARGVTLAFSILLGFAGAAFLLQFPGSNTAFTLFPVERVRPASISVASSPFDEVEQITEWAPQNSLPVEDSLSNEELAEETQIVEHEAPTQPEQASKPVAEVVPAIGGPVTETPIEEISAGISNDEAIGPEDVTIGGDVSKALEEYEVSTESGALNVVHKGGVKNSNVQKNNVGNSDTGNYAAESVPSSPENPLKASYTVLVQATLGVKARTLPSTEGQVLDVLGYGKGYQAIGRTSNGGWIQVELDEETAVWIITEAVDGLLFDINGKIVALDELPSVAIGQ